MTLKEYINNLNELVKEKPELLDAVVIYAGDDEGNNYDEVHYTPTIGDYDTDEGDFIPEADFEELEDGDDNSFGVNSVCIN